MHYQGRQLCHFLFCLSTQFGSTLKGKNLLLREQILFFKSRADFRKAFLLKEANRKSQMLSPFIKMVEKHGGVPIHHKKLLCVIALDLEKVDFSFQCHVKNC